ncbi:MAG: hypothetical protein LBT00_06030 [Spirochaetaceae bacterium]|nr:hypothetical protein [Spirochaetaceae bacterium]
MRTTVGYQKGRLLYLIFALFSLCSGCAVYYFFRNGNILFYGWTGLADLPGFQRQNAGPLPAFFVWLTGSLPDGLWVLSGIMLLRCVLWNNKKLCGVYLFIFCCFAIAYELLQILENMRGTFDPADVCFMVLAVVFERTLAKKRWFQKEPSPV